MVSLAALSAHALGTTAGTQIQNTAQVSYSIGGAAITTSSNTSIVTVAEILDANVTTLNATQLVSAGSAAQEIAFRLTNTGNGTETFTLLRESNVTGDDFDPIPGVTSIYFDTDGSGDFSGADIAYVPGSNDPVLAPDTSVVVLLVHDIPASVLDSQRGRVQITASAATGSGAPGTVFNNAGPGNVVDAVVGSSGASSTAAGEYVVASVQLTAIKSQSIADQFGGTRPIPGARINYQIQVNVVGAGTATGVNFSDVIPTHTTYVPGSLRLNSAALTDTPDADSGQFLTTPAPQVRLTLGDLTSVSGPQVIEFAVTIN